MGLLEPRPKRVGCCFRCGLPLRAPNGAWQGVMPLGLGAWVCHPCIALSDPDPMWELSDLPDDMKPEWNR